MSLALLFHYLLVYLYSTFKMMHGPIKISKNIFIPNYLHICLCTFIVLVLQHVSTNNNCRPQGEYLQKGIFDAESFCHQICLLCDVA